MTDGAGAGAVGPAFREGHRRRQRIVCLSCRLSPLWLTQDPHRSTEGVTDIMNKLDRLVGGKGWKYHAPNGGKYTFAFGIRAALGPRPADLLSPLR